MTSTRPYRGVFPVAPTIFGERGNLDLDGQRRYVDFMIDAGSQGLWGATRSSRPVLAEFARRD